MVLDEDVNGFKAQGRGGKKGGKKSKKVRCWSLRLSVFSDNLTEQIFRPRFCMGPQRNV